ncbi:MAG: hypothetical protein Q7S35_06215 [Candidatus Limnocylindrales bacterium]|nr:hypothetical protein [Candidatus Limnocylindrales bacterium]
MTDAIDDGLDATGRVAGSDEARGPHLPDALAGIPTGAWVFSLLAIARLIWFVREAHLGPAPGPSVVLAFVTGIVPAVVAVLLPGALLLRHADAWSRARTLLLGTVLFAVVEGMRVLSPSLQPFFEQLTPGSEETPYLVPLALLYTSAEGLLAIFAVTNIGLGLAQARRYLDRSGTRLIVVVAALIVVLVAVERVVSVSQLPFDEIPMTPTVAVYLASAIVLGVLSIAAWGYLAATSVRGARAGEEPEAGWTIGAIGACLIVAAFGLSAAGSLARPSPETQDLFNSIGQGISVIYTLGYLGLLGGLLLGLPSLEPIEDDEEDDVVGALPDLDQPVD